MPNVSSFDLRLVRQTHKRYAIARRVALRMCGEVGPGCKSRSWRKGCLGMALDARRAYHDAVRRAVVGVGA